LRRGCCHEVLDAAVGLWGELELEDEFEVPELAGGYEIPAAAGAGVWRAANLAAFGGPDDGGEPGVTEEVPVLASVGTGEFGPTGGGVHRRERPLEGLGPGHMGEEGDGDCRDKPHAEPPIERLRSSVVARARGAGEIAAGWCGGGRFAIA
jgi:hypothetical protein